MTANLIHNTKKYVGTSFDTKPTTVGFGSTFWEYDTRVLYITYDGTNWVVKDSATWMFGEPVLRASGNGWARWTSANALSQTQKGGGWAAELYGGLQTGAASWAACFIPTGERPLIQFNSAQWSWYQTANEAYGVNIVVWVHDPTDFDKRAEITQSGSATSLDKLAGQNSHEFPGTAAEFFFYGEGAGGSALNAGTLYTWAQFQADVPFSTWVIYRISLEFGWYSAGTFESAFLEEVKLGNTYLQLKPPAGYVQPAVTTYTTGTSAALATLSPGADFELTSVRIYLASALASAETLTVTADINLGAVYDATLFTLDLGTPDIRSLVIPFGEGYTFTALDDIVVALSANTGTDTWSCSTLHRLV